VGADQLIGLDRPERVAGSPAPSADMTGLRDRIGEFVTDCREISCDRGDVIDAVGNRTVPAPGSMATAVDDEQWNPSIASAVQYT